MLDVFPDTIEIVAIADDMLVIITLPKSGARRIANCVDQFCGSIFTECDDLTQRDGSFGNYSSGFGLRIQPWDEGTSPYEEHLARESHCIPYPEEQQDAFP